MRFVFLLLILILLAPSALALNYGSYQNDSCGILDAFNFKFKNREKGEKILEIKEECANPTEESRAKEAEKDNGYNEYETYKRMLYYDTVDF